MQGPQRDSGELDPNAAVPMVDLLTASACQWDHCPSHFHFEQVSIHQFQMRTNSCDNSLLQGLSETT